MKLYKLMTQFWGKDLDEKAELGYLVASSEEEVAEYLSQKYHHGYWFDLCEEKNDEEIEVNRQDIITHKGDFHTEFAGEFYDQKYGWEEVGDITEDQLVVLKTFGIVLN